MAALVVLSIPSLCLSHNLRGNCILKLLRQGVGLYLLSDPQVDLVQLKELEIAQRLLLSLVVVEKCDQIRNHWAAPLRRQSLLVDQGPKKTYEVLLDEIGVWLSHFAGEDDDKFVVSVSVQTIAL